MILPTKPSLGSLVVASIKFPSTPDKPTAEAPCNSNKFTSVLFIFPAKTICTISIISSSVTRKPSTKLGIFPKRLVI